METVQMKSEIMMAIFRNRKILIAISDGTGLRDVEIMEILKNSNASKVEVDILYREFTKIMDSMSEKKVSLVTK